MTLFDFGVIGIFLFSSVWGFMRGFTQEVLSIISWIAAIVVAVIGLPHAYDFALHYISNPMLAKIATGVGLFILTLIVFSVISAILSSLVKGSALSSVDRSLGFLFGLTRGIVIVCLIELSLTLLAPRGQQAQAIEQAKSIRMIRHGADFLVSITPQAAMDGLKTLRDKVMGQTAPATASAGTTPPGSTPADLAMKLAQQAISVTPAPASTSSAPKPVR